MPKHNDDGHRLDDAITRRYERLWLVVERQRSRIETRSPYFIRYMRLLKSLHCLPVRYHIIFKIFKFIAYSDEKGCLA